MKGPVAARAGAGAVGGHNPEMIRGACTQAQDVCKDILVSVPSFGLVGCCGPVTGRSSILETHGGGQSVRINRTVKSG